MDGGSRFNVYSLYAIITLPNNKSGAVIGPSFLFDTLSIFATYDM